MYDFMNTYLGSSLQYFTQMAALSFMLQWIILSSLNKYLQVALIFLC